MDEDYHAFDYDAHYCDTTIYESYDAFEDLYADAQFEPYFGHDHDSDFNHLIDIDIEGVDNERDDTGFRELEAYIEGGDEDDVEYQSGLGGYDGGIDYEDVHVGDPVSVEWGNQLEEDDDAGDDRVDDELVGAGDEDEGDSLSLSSLLRDGITPVIEQLERATVEQLESRLYSCNWTMSSVPSFRGREERREVEGVGRSGGQFNVSPNSTVRSSSSSGASNGDREGEVDKGKELVQSATELVSCPICMEHWTNAGEHSVCSLPCGHLYGMSCIKRWLQQHNPGKCPQCKKICKLEDVRRLYGSIAVVDKHLEEKIRFLEAKCASLELKDSEWKKKEAQWRQKEADLSRQLVNKEKADDLLDAAEVHAQNIRN